MTAYTAAGSTLEEEIPDDLFEGLPVDERTITPLVAAVPAMEIEAPMEAPLDPTDFELSEAQAEEGIAPTPDQALFATLPKLPSIEGFSLKLQAIQLSLMEAQAEADSLREEIQKKASALRALAGALEAAI